MHRRLIASLLIGASLLLSACVSAPAHRLYEPAAQPLPITASDFPGYQRAVRQWLEQHRVLVSGDPGREIDANTPFSAEPHRRTGKGILLVHGLGDSPYSFVDIAPALAKQGFLVPYHAAAGTRQPARRHARYQY